VVKLGKIPTKTILICFSYQTVHLIVQHRESICTDCVLAGRPWEPFQMGRLNSGPLWLCFVSISCGCVDLLLLKRQTFGTFRIVHVYMNDGFYLWSRHLCSVEQDQAV